MDFKMNERELLRKFVAGNCPDSEKELVLDWIEENESNKEEFARVKNMHVLEQLQLFGSEEKRRRNMHRFIRAAAIFLLFITLSAGGYFALQHYSKPTTHIQQEPRFTYMVNTGVKGLVELPDGSKVWLNSSSQIICPQKFSDKYRELELEGEGYFEVIPNKDWPMIVKTSKDYSIKVTGTSFNLSSYSDDDKLIVTLISGEVSLIGKKQNEEIKLTPNQELVIHSRQPKLSDNVDTKKKTAWKEGILIFENTPMNEVVKKVERWYGVKIQVEDQKILDYRFTAKFKSESITQVLEILRISSNIKYMIEENIVTLKI